MNAPKTMLVAVCIVALLALAAPGGGQQSLPARLATGFDTIREESLRADLTFLASDALQGRMALQPGDDVAIEWIASEFAKAGLKPASSGSYLQPVDLVEFRADRAQSYVALKRAGSEKRWKFPDAIGSYRSDVDVTADVVFAGFGITSPELHYDDYQGIDVRGKIVLIFDHEPQETDASSIFNGTGNTRYATTRVKVLNAQAHGAVGVLIVAEPSPAKNSHEKLQVPGAYVNTSRGLKCVAPPQMSQRIVPTTPTHRSIEIFPIEVIRR